MSNVFCLGVVFLVSFVNGFDSEKFLKDNCEMFSTTLSCSYVKFSTEDNNEIQDTKFIISNATYVRFQHCFVVANGAFFEKFPNTRQVDFEDCYIDLVTSTRRIVPAHKELRKINVMTSEVKNGYGTANTGLETLSNLKGISFYSTKLSNGISNGFFQQVPQIEDISIGFCDLYTYSSDSFRGLSELQSLNIFGNSYFNLNVDMFADLKKLLHLYLESNGIDQLAAKVLPPNLQTLNLRNNSLRFITGNMFSQLTSLEGLYLVENEIEQVSEKSFDNLGKLKYLQLQHNKIKTFTQRHLNGTKNLIHVDVSSNAIEDLDCGVFDGLGFLEWFNF